MDNLLELVRLRPGMYLGLQDSTVLAIAAIRVLEHALEGPWNFKVQAGPEGAFEIVAEGGHASAEQQVRIWAQLTAGAAGALDPQDEHWQLVCLSATARWFRLSLRSAVIDGFAEYREGKLAATSSSSRREKSADGPTIVRVAWLPDASFVSIAGDWSVDALRLNIAALSARRPTTRWRLSSDSQPEGFELSTPTGWEGFIANQRGRSPLHGPVSFELRNTEAGFSAAGERCGLRNFEAREAADAAGLTAVLDVCVPSPRWAGPIRGHFEDDEFELWLCRDLQSVLDARFRADPEGALAVVHHVTASHLAYWR